MMLPSALRAFFLIFPAVVNGAGVRGSGKPVSRTVNVLIMGDSWAENAGNAETLQDQAPKGVTIKVKNIGIGGTTTSYWADPHNLNTQLDNLGTFVPDFVWLSLGGNDVFQNQCATDQFYDGVRDSLQGIVNGLTTRYSGVQILQTGYSVPSLDDYVQDTCNALQVYNDIQDIFSTRDYGDAVTFVPISDMFAGFLSETAYINGDPTFYEDPIHLNDAGYEELFQYKPIVRALTGGRGK